MRREQCLSAGKQDALGPQFGSWQGEMVLARGMRNRASPRKIAMLFNLGEPQCNSIIKECVVGVKILPSD